VVGYSGDSGPSDALTEIARDADLFVCEATLQRRTRRAARGAT
jgi:ribonuclease BN (tRNA processing enzyme)